ncbi:AraC family transcriptional regulator [Rhodanobacter sp. A1T4]|uniref:AraC family transcriptional regulator n=1 Tax=Rhodanobacter sp. A1T4 TaxID=2723087 RepID=UPI001617267D|nr:AraC family transcriptional regulator [Rhodanobacter sp. A1T4]MBB6246683.1 AraC family ethanolamine operon transcriptional activator [Rhodanobacter sp. A1T4]
MSPIPTDSFMPSRGLDAMNQLFDQCKFEAVALRGSGLRGLSGSRLHAGASLCSFVFDFPCHGRFPVPHGNYLLCHVHHASPESWCTGMPLRSGTTVIGLPGNSCEMMLSAHSMVSVLMAPLHDGVMRVLERNPVSFGLMGHRFSIYGPECLAGTPWGFRCESAFHALVCTRGGEGNAVGEDFFDALLDPRVLDDLAARPRGPVSNFGRHRAHYRSFRRAVDFMRANLQDDIYLDELARSTGMSERALRYAFADLLGVSPARYLALLRLHEASRRLSAAGVGRLSVKSVAMSCGWWDLSRFAANYRRAFDEHPSDTLMRACGVAC